MSMRRGGLCAAFLVVLLGLALLAGGCGGGGSSSPSSTSSTQKTAAGPEPNAKFKTSKAGQELVQFGKEGSLTEWEAANAVVVKNLKAREAGNWAEQCETLDQVGIEQIEGAKNHKDCPAKLKAIGEPLSTTKEIRVDTLSGSIAVLRVKGNRGYALYHGNDGQDHAMPLEKEDGAWRVSSLKTINLAG